MSVKNTGFVEFHIQGRLIFIGGFFVPVGVLFFALERESMLLICTLILGPLALFCMDAISKRTLLARVDLETSLHIALKKSGIKWLYGYEGSGILSFNREAQGLPRTIADSSLLNQLEEVPVPDGLIEPEVLHGSKPSNVITSFIAIVGCLFIVYLLMIITQSAVPANIKLFVWFLMPVLLFSIFLLVVKLPVFQKTKILPEVFRRLGRGQLLKRGFVVGPGWVKYRKTVWNGNTDILLIRRAGRRSASAEVVCLLVSNTKRKRIRFNGVNDQDFRTFFGYWNVDEVRLEFIDSDLS